MSDLILLCCHELLIIILLAIHLKNNENVFSCDKKPFPVVLGNSLFNLLLISDHYFFIVSLIIKSVRWSFHRKYLFFVEEQIKVKLRNILLETQFDHLIISLVKQVKCIFVSHLNEFKLSHDLWVNNPEFIINTLIKYHVIDDTVDLFAYCSDPCDSIFVNILKQFVYFWNWLHLVYNISQELFNIVIIVIDTEKQAIEYSHWVCINIIWMFF